MSQGKIITRMAPSPTGLFHIGTFRTALFNYLFTRKMGGTFFLRIEDTDKERSKKEYEDDIVAGMKWLGLDYDGMVRQSERVDLHRSYLEKMIESGHAYISKEEENTRETVSEKAVMEGRRSEVIRFKNPNKKVTFKDLILGDITVDTTDLGDFVVAKDLDTPLYNFVVVVDDIEMEITNVIRGQDHIANTPRQILIYEALGKVPPSFAHIPLILAPDKSKLSKRKHGATVSIGHYRDLGYLPEALLNFFALLGWNPGGEKEIFNKEELVKLFDIERVQKSSAIFNMEKLDWMNREYIKMMPKDAQEKYLQEIFNGYLDTIKEKGLLPKVAPLIVDRLGKMSNVQEMIEKKELDYVTIRPEYSAEKLLWKELDGEAVAQNIKYVISIIESLPEDNFTDLVLKERIMDYLRDKEKGATLHPMRFALSGMDKSPDPFVISGILGKKETIARLQIAIDALTK
jgi:glutamyl-tRNA synthetase